MQFKITKQLRAFFSVVALFAFSITFAQNPTVTISVPFSDGAIGIVGQNTQKNDNAKSFATLGISRVYFSQEVDASSGVFYDDPSTQGNNIIGQLQSSLLMEIQLPLTVKLFGEQIMNHLDL